MSQVENSNQVSLPVTGEHGSLLYAIYKVIICNFVFNVTFVTLMSGKTPQRCLQSMFMTRSNILTSNKFIDTIIKYIYLSCVLCTAIFNVYGVTVITGHLQKPDHRKLVKHGFLRPPDMSLTENSNQLFLPGGCNRTQNLRFGP